jgi:serine/threonine-protein kinase
VSLLDDPDRWRRLDALLVELLELDEAQRAARLRAIAAEDAALHRDLEALLRADSAGGALDRSAAALGAALLIDAPADDGPSPATAAATAASGPLTGRRLAHFTVGERLGSGGAGVVYRAFDERLRRPVALKFFGAGTPAPPADSPTSSLAHERLLREARAAASLVHPGIVVIHEVGSAAGMDFIAMELVDGRPLHALIPAAGLPFDVAVDYAIQIAEALGHAHAHGVVHSDLKPGNLVVTPAGRVKVLDFGIARATGTPTIGIASRTPTRISTTLGSALAGTPQYMSPEQVQGRPVDARCDLFALGCVLYEMLAGEGPFQRSSIAETAVAVVDEEPVPLARRRRDVSRRLAATVERALRKAPERRYSSAEAMLADLRALHGRQGPRRGWWIAAALAAAAAAVLTAAAALL